MRNPALVRSLVIGAISALAIGTVGCSAAYWGQIGAFTTVRADLAAAGKIDWTVTRDEVSGDVTKTVSTYTNPSITVTLDANSAPVNYTTAQADFFYTEGAVTDAGKVVTNPLADVVPTQYFPFAAQLKTIDRSTSPVAQTLVLHGLIPTTLIDLTDPILPGYQRLTGVVATVKLTGENGFGAKVTTTVNVPININYK